MKIYDEITKEEIESPDLLAGYIYDGFYLTGYTDEYYKVIEETITEERPNGLNKFYPSKPIYEERQYYHKYTEDELNPPKTDYATWSELAEAYKKGVDMA